MHIVAVAIDLGKSLSSDVHLPTESGGSRRFLEAGDGRAAEGKTFGEFGFFCWPGWRGLAEFYLSLALFL